MRRLVIIATLATLASPAVAFDVYEWLVAVKDPGHKLKVHLPPFVDTRHKRAIGDGPPPPHGGLIFSGTAPNMLDVVVTFPERTSYASSWPPATTRDQTLSWSALRPAPAPSAPTTNLKWWQNLRTGNLSFRAKGKADSIFLYEAASAAVHDYRLATNDDKTTKLEIRDGATKPAKSWLLQPTDDVWRGAPFANDAGTPADAPSKLLSEILREVTEKAPATLTTHLQDTLQHALKEGRRAALIMLPEEASLPATEILPLPDTHRRFLFIAILERDQRQQKDWQKLIDQLGATEWTERETATATLAESGEAALPHLNKALKSKNLEIVDRVERLIMRLGHNPDKVGEKLKKRNQLEKVFQEEW
jgi:hypothetical protein